MAHVTRRAGSRRAGVVAVTVLAAILAGSLALPRSAEAADGPSLQVMEVGVGPDGTVRTVAQSSAARRDDGTVATARVALDPVEAGGKLPLRVQTAFWLDGADGSRRSGTDLSAIRGAAGRVTIQYSLQNLTVRPQDVSWVDPSTGSARHRIGLVGVPLTVVASATVAGQGGAGLVTVAQTAGQAVTDGVVSDAPGGGRQVQWAVMLAPPMLPSSVTFSLVQDTSQFVPPGLQLTVQPGLVTDPSLETLLTSTLGGQGPIGALESSVLDLLTRVNGELDQVSATAEKVHRAVAEDAQTLGSNAYQELRASSTSMLAQITATQQTTVSLRDQASSQIQSSASQLGAGLADVLNQISAALGSGTAKPLLTVTTINGCTMGLPELADGQPRTLAATIQLIEAQVGAVARAFAQPDGVDPQLGACRQQLVDLLGAAIGTPGQVCAPTDPQTVQCAISDARARVWSQIAALQQLNDQVAGLLSHAGVPPLGVRVLDLAAGFESLRSGVQSIQTDLAAGSAAINAALTTLTSDLTAITSALDGISQPGPGNDPLDTLEAAILTIKGAKATYDATLADIHAKALALSPPPTPPTLPPVASVEQVIGLTPTFAVVPGGLMDQILALGAAPPCPAVVLPLADRPAVMTALTDLAAVPTCPARQMADALLTIIPAYDTATTTASAAVAAYTDATVAHDADHNLLLAIGQLSDPVTNPKLAGAEAALTGALTDLGSAATTIRNQVDAARAAMALAQADVVTIQDAVTAGHLAQAGQTAKDLLTLVLPGLRGSLQPGAVPCPANWSDPIPPLPTPAIDAIIALSDRLTCLNGEITTTLDGWFTTAQDSLTVAQDDLGVTAAQAAQAGLDLAVAGIGGASDALTAVLTGPVSATVRDDLAAIDANQANAQANVQRIMSDLTSAAQESVTRLVSQVEQSTTNSEAARQQLQADFSRVMANLGDPNPTSRLGLLGKLHDVADQVGLAATQVSTTSGGVVGYTVGLRTSLSTLDLFDAQVKAARQRQSAWHPFADQAGTTVFTYRMDGN